jgi:hypothetical protein
MAEPFNKKSKHFRVLPSLQTLASAAVCNALNPAYRPILLQTLLHHQGYRDELVGCVERIAGSYRALIHYLKEHSRTLDELPSLTECRNCQNEEVHIEYDQFFDANETNGALMIEKDYVDDVFNEIGVARKNLKHLKGFLLKK